MKSARITLELSGSTLDKLLFLARHYDRTPDELTLDLLHAAISRASRIQVLASPK